MNSSISFNWDIHWACNYNCPYCWFHDKWAGLKHRNLYLEPKKIIDAWERIYKLYGKTKVSITGGEPFLYPGFKEILRSISEMHRIEVITNLSVDIGDVVNDIKSKDVTINPSFHPLNANTEEFIKKTLLLLNNNLTKAVTIVAWPPMIKELNGYIASFNKYRDLFVEKSAGISIQPFNGAYNGKQYPVAYSEQELLIIGKDMGSRGGKEFSTKPIETKSKLCNAGVKYGIIQPDGEVQRCGSINTSVCKVGNFFDKDFELLESAVACTSDSCVCNEWAFLLQTLD